VPFSRPLLQPRCCSHEAFELLSGYFNSSPSKVTKRIQALCGEASRKKCIAEFFWRFVHFVKLCAQNLGLMTLRVLLGLAGCVIVTSQVFPPYDGQSNKYEKPASPMPTSQRHVSAQLAAAQLGPDWK